MAGIKIKSTYKVKGSTLIEVVISMVIIVVIFTIAMGIYANILRSSLSVKKYQAQETLNKLMNQSEKSPKTMNQTFNLNDFQISRKISPYRNHTNLLEIHLAAFNQNKEKLAEIRKVIYEP
ncbi:prepilin-type N-terminal cleavage/methylation domain-containing protein [Daejeonella oryzae]|uniref:prepilin-type N-terminal cleavage/methylation domain-containing protein n=1 Tax=Daejeonella oryzae TaxID=1122943 RepID=UPI00047D3974|nr:prepilin-type N-terminal cleavage/methylation domain-containing protein [Daejeonella oryzae]